MDAKHTPGPWNIYHDDKNEMVISPERVHPSDAIAKMVWPKSLKNIRVQEANAKLIAAAPKMLDALQKCIWKDCSKPMGIHGAHYLRTVNAIAQAAITKATE